MKYQVELVVWKEPIVWFECYSLDPVNNDVLFNIDWLSHEFNMYWVK